MLPGDELAVAALNVNDTKTNGSPRGRKDAIG
jgi:hypothetical protein